MDSEIDQWKKLLGNYGIEGTLLETFVSQLIHHGFVIGELDLLCTLNRDNLVEMGIFENADQNKILIALEKIETDNNFFEEGPTTSKFFQHKLRSDLREEIRKLNSNLLETQCKLEKERSLRKEMTSYFTSFVMGVERVDEPHSSIYDSDDSGVSESDPHSPST